METKRIFDNKTKRFVIDKTNRSYKLLAKDFFHVLITSTGLRLCSTVALLFAVFSVILGLLMRKNGKVSTNTEIPFIHAALQAANLILTADIFGDEAIENNALSILSFGSAWIFSIVFSVYIIGIAFHRYRSGTSRGKSLLFSPRCHIRTDSKGNIAAKFAIVEARRHQLIGAALSIFVFDHHTLRMLPVESETEKIFPALPQIVEFYIESKSGIVAESSSGSIAQYIIDNIEILAVIDGSEPITGLSVRVYHSFFTSSEITLEAIAPTCATLNADGSVVVDFMNFSSA
jgi:hypothetical protein